MQINFFLFAIVLKKANNFCSMYQRVLNDLQRARLSRVQKDLVPHPPPPPSSVSKLDRRHTGRLRKRDKLLTGEGGKGVGEEPNHTTAKTAWSFINHSVLSATVQCTYSDYTHFPSFRIMQQFLNTSSKTFDRFFLLHSLFLAIKRYVYKTKPKFFL